MHTKGVFNFPDIVRKSIVFQQLTPIAGCAFHVECLLFLRDVFAIASLVFTCLVSMRRGGGNFDLLHSTQVNLNGIE